MAYEQLAIGIYKARVNGVTLEAVGEKNTPAIIVGLVPTELLNGPVFVPVELSTPNGRKYYWLSEKTIDRGDNAGRTSIEVLRDELKAVYDYEGPLDPDALQALVGKEVQINVQAGNGKYTEVRWVNKVGDKPRGKSKSIDPSVLARLNASFSGKKGTGTAANAQDFFSGLDKAA